VVIRINRIKWKCRFRNGVVVNGVLKASNLGGYTRATSIPAIDENMNFTNNTGTNFTLIASFITDAGEPGITAFPLGTSYRNITGKIDSGFAKYRVEVYRIDADGSNETLLKTGESNAFGNIIEASVTWNITDATSYVLQHKEYHLNYILLVLVVVRATLFW
jgi:hypothetical protein